MHIKHHIVCLLFIVVLKSTKEDTMSWNESHKLTWTDFKLNPNLKTDVVALTASDITFGYSAKTPGERVVDFSISVEACFYPNKSWCLKEKDNAHNKARAITF
tara:strand:- start:305 stop:613 length:309 start_codon:yes stop_codon:yes gene_type:complete